MPEIDPHEQRQFAMDVVRQLRARGFEAYWAGGCVRDQLLGRQPKDYDVATAARPAEIREIFGRRRTLEIGAAFGVVSVLGTKQAGQIEVTTFRQDAQYSDGRHPDSVRFSTPEMDAQRRDFTINGLFFDPVSGEVIDFVGGQEDLRERLVRAIGVPDERFVEDKLRLLRAVRFATVFDFQIEPETRAAVARMAAEVTVVSSERIAQELRLMLVHPRRARAVALMAEVGLLRPIFPELVDPKKGTFYFSENQNVPFSLMLRVLEGLEGASFPLALAALLGGALDGRAAAVVCRRLKLSTREVRQTGWLVEHQAALAGAAQQPWSTLQRLLVSPGIEELLVLHAARCAAEGTVADDVQYARRMLALPRDQLDPPPLVTGDDLIAHGVPKGKQYQRILWAVRDAQLEKKIQDKRQALELVEKLREQRGEK